MNLTNRTVGTSAMLVVQVGDGKPAGGADEEQHLARDQLVENLL
jgi:hypothetical protein